MRHSLSLAAATAIATLWAQAAAAATVTQTFSVSLTDFQPYFTSDPAPVDPLLASFTLTYDTETTVADSTAGLVIHSLNFTPDGQVAWSFTPDYAPGSALLRLGGISAAPGDDTAAFTAGQRDFTFSFFLPDVGAPSGATGALQLGTGEGVWIAETGTVSATVAAVPEPSTWALAILGFAAAGAALRGRRRGLA